MAKFRDFVELPERVRSGIYVAIISQAIIIILQLIVIVLLIARPPH